MNTLNAVDFILFNLIVPAGVFEEFLSLGDAPFDNSVDLRKYGFWREGDAIILEIRNIDFGDAAT